MSRDVALRRTLRPSFAGCAAASPLRVKRCLTKRQLQSQHTVSAKQISVSSIAQSGQKAALVFGRYGSCVWGSGATKVKLIDDRFENAFTKPYQPIG